MKISQASNGLNISKSNTETTASSDSYLYGLDLFRLIAAFLVIAIHTSPLMTFSEAADFFFTRVAARIAVPFFLMLTGYFIVADFLPHPDMTHGYISGKNPGNYLKKLILMYLISMLIYLPIGIYSGLYRHLSLRLLLRMLIFDGSFYHLWYFPACILGILLIYILSRFLPIPAITGVSILLYLIGLFGDSYYGLTHYMPVVHNLYDRLFSISSYTRNGLFFAPVFLMMGASIARKHRLFPKGNDTPSEADTTTAAIGFILSFICMTSEAFLLHTKQLQRHDSMYLMLIPVMYFLYIFLLGLTKPRDNRINQRKNHPSINLRKTATWIYIIHPAVIIFVRLIGKLLHITNILVSNSLIHYITVSVFSFILAWLLTAIIRYSKIHFKALKVSDKPNITSRAWIELDMTALADNVSYLRSKLAPTSCLMPAVKANAYGHGDIPIAKALNRLGIKHFCVACADEGVKLRQNGIKGEILILGYTHPDSFSLLSKYRLTQTVVDYEYAGQLNNFGKKLHVHIGIDTGMHRLGIRSENTDKIFDIFEMSNLKIDGILTHLSVSDSISPKEKAFTTLQATRFQEILSHIRRNGYDLPKTHLLASYGLLNYPELGGDYVRVGIALYGILSTKEDTCKYADMLTPVLSIKARVASIRTLHKEESAGYGMAFTAARETKIATLAIGYADGLPRSLSNGVGSVLINGRRAKIIGRICMDQMSVDVTDIPSVKSGDIATIIGTSGNETIRVTDIAEETHTITNEVLSRLGTRLERVVSHEAPTKSVVSR